MKQNYLKSIFISLVFSTLSILVIPMANAEPQLESQADTKIINFIKAVGFPKGLNVIKTGPTSVVIWNYPHAVNGKDMYILFEDGQPKSVSINGKVVMSAIDG